MANNLSGNGYGVRVEHSFNVTVEDNSVTSSVSFAIHVQYTPFTVVSENGVSNNTNGIALFSSSNATVADNYVFFSKEIGIALTRMTNVTVTANTLLHDGIWLDGNSVSNFNSHIISTDNSVNGKPLRYYKDCSDVVLDGLPVGQLLVANCTGFVGTNLTILDTDTGVGMYFVDDAMMASNNISSNDWGGIVLGFSNNITFTANGIFENENSGFLMGASSNITLTANKIISNDPFSIIVILCGNLSVHHNNFISSPPQAYTLGSPGNSWDDGYPSGGNYWSDYAGADSFNGPNQDIPGGDGIGDTPYVIDSDNEDRYPLMEPGI
jgi:parallel beta-helix repeat protein